MRFQTLTIILLLASSLSFAQGRKPAVEDFVGIEVEHAESNPQGTEGLFNFEQDMHKFERNKIPASVNPSAKANWTEPKSSTTNTMAFFGIAIILGLPALTCFLLMNHFRQKAQLESASNIKVLEKYRRDREELKRSQDEYKKAS